MSDAVQTLDASAAHANTRRHELAGQVGRMLGAMKLALIFLDAAECASHEVRCLVDEARRALRLAIKEGGR